MRYHKAFQKLLLLLMVVFILSSCKSGKDTSTVQEETSSAAEEKETEKPVQEESSEAESEELEIIEESESETAGESSEEPVESEASEPESSEESAASEPFEESVESESSEESSIEEEQTPEQTPVQADSPVDSFYVDVPRPSITLSEIPAYDGRPSVTLNNGTPFFDEDIIQDVQIWLTPLDEMGRCGAVMMLAGPESLPTAKRKSISSIHPTGWVQNQYPDLINEAEGRLYRRCHMLMYALSGLNATEENLVTGTFQLNQKAMLGDEEKVLNYIRETGHHVVYRVTPFFEGEDLLMQGLLVEASSLEDDAISICLYCYNVQPGVEIDYATGENQRAEAENVTRQQGETSETEISQEEGIERDYVLNTNPSRMRFHTPECWSVDEIDEENREDVHCTRESLLDEGYTPCGNCNP